MHILISILVLATATLSQAIELSNAAFKITIDNDTGALSSVVHPDDPAGMNWISDPNDNTPWLPPSAVWGLGFADLGDESMHRAFWSRPVSIEKIDDDAASSSSSSPSVTVTYELSNLLRITVVRALHHPHSRSPSSPPSSSPSFPIFTERYTFTNLSPTNPLNLRGEEDDPTSLAIYTPVNDHYTNSTDVEGHRAHAHIWPRGGASSWIKNTRMGGEGKPHLGLVLTEGGLVGYSVEARDTVTMSNTRGAISVHPGGGDDDDGFGEDLGVGKERSIGWAMFWHEDWEDFFEKCGEASEGQFVEFDVLSSGGVEGKKDEEEEVEGLFSVLQGEEVRVRVKGRRRNMKGSTLNGIEMSEVTTEKETNSSSSWSVYEVSLGSDLEVGEHKLELKMTGTGHNDDDDLKSSNNSTTATTSYAFIAVLPSIDTLISNRVQFITEKQQIPDDDNDTLSGAYVVYDNQMQARVTFDTASDRNAGRERVGMGVLIATWLRLNQDHENREAVEKSLIRYYTFVCTQLQNQTSGYVYNTPGAFDEEASKAHLRLYNWPWVMHLHVSMALLVLENKISPSLSFPPQLQDGKSSLDRFMTTLESFYDLGGATYYPIGLPIMQGLRALSLSSSNSSSNSSHQQQQLHNRALSLFLTHAHQIVKTGTEYPSSEVNYEQSIVAPAAIIPLELYRYTGEEWLLDASLPHMDRLLRFQGWQPDYRLRDVAIRHWDGYWFGKDRMWGDTFPHYWSSLSGVAVWHYGAAVGEEEEEGGGRRKAEGIMRANVAGLFDLEGKGEASCAYLYPDKVNGRETGGGYRDPYANDQDWALVYYLMLREGLWER